MPENIRPEELRGKSVSTLVNDITQQAQAALESGARATAELNEITRRAEDSLDWQKQIERHRWVAMGIVIGASLLTYLIVTRKA